MKSRVFITLSKSGAVKMTKEKPSLDINQRAVRLTISVPDSAFAAPPVLDVELEIPGNLMIAPEPAEPLTVEIWDKP